MGERDGVLIVCPLVRDTLLFESETEDVKSGASLSARLINCKGVNGEPAEDIDLREWGLPLFGVDRINEGISGKLESGVLGRSGILFPSFFGANDFGIDWNRSAK